MVGLKIAIVSNMGLDPREGGTEYYTGHLIGELERQGHEVSFACRDGDPMGRSAMPRGKVAFARAARRFLREKGPDGILCQGGWFTIMPALACKAKRPGTRVVYAFHTHYDRPWPFYKRALYSRLLARCDGVGFLSRGLMENVRECAGVTTPDDPLILYSAPTTPRVTESEAEEFRSRFGIERDKKYLLGLGLLALEHKKDGAKLLISVLARMSRDRPDLRLILTRTGPYEGEVMRFARECGVDRQVIFTGIVKDPYVALSVADVYTHITYGEGHSSAVLHAMAMGKPIVASNVGGMPETIDDGATGILVQNDVEAISKAIGSVLDDEALGARLGASAKKAVFERFGWERTATALVKALSPS